MTELSKPKNKEVIEAQLEIVQGYYNRYVLRDDVPEDLKNSLQSDLDYMKGEIAVLEAETILNNPDKF